jgi:hypothetical protein
MNIRKIGSKGAFRDFDDSECAWCEAAAELGTTPMTVDGEPVGVVHLENDQGNKRTVTCTDDRGQLVLECEPYVFFSG